jgi:hypothetical protein
VHIFTEEAFLDSYTLFGNEVGYFFVELLGQLRLGGGVEAWAAALSTVAVQRKIADEQNPAADVKQVPIHLAVLIREDTHVHEFLSDEFGVFNSVLFADTEVNEQPFFDFTNCLANHFNLCL